MKFTSSLSLLLLALPSTSLAFAPASNNFRISSSLASTLSPEPPTRKGYDDGDDNGKDDVLPIQITTQKIIEISPNTVETSATAPAAASTSTLPEQQFGPLSMSFEDLAVALGGAGRARIAWDCYKLGIDPAHMFGSVINLGNDDYESIVSKLPSQRRTQRLGVETLNKLQQLYKESYGGQTNPSVTKVEGGVATLSFISRAADGTTKLLLKLSDGLEVETVIIPWKGTRSTLCISSQVGCRQGTYCTYIPYKEKSLN